MAGLPGILLLWLHVIDNIVMASEPNNSNDSFGFESLAATVQKLEERLLAQERMTSQLNEKIQEYEHERTNLLKTVERHDIDIKKLSVENRALKEQVIARRKDNSALRKENARLRITLGKKMGKQLAGKVERTPKCQTCNSSTGGSLNEKSTSPRLTDEFARIPHVRQISTNQVAFSAVQINQLTLGVHETVIFDKIQTNVGNAYHQHSGIFLAPVSGVYVFFLQSMVAEGEQEYLDVHLSGKTVMKIFPNAEHAQHSAASSGLVVLEMRAGEEVWVRAEGGTGHVYGGDYTTFSGWLLFANDQ